MTEYLKALVDNLQKEIVICDMDHKILYMNPYAVEHYRSRFGDDLIGKNLLDCHNERSRSIIKEKIEYAIANNIDSMQISDHPDKKKKSYITLIKDKNQNIIGYYERYEGDAF